MATAISMMVLVHTYSLLILTSSWWAVIETMALKLQ
jgi:hypothetical protein